MRSKEGKSLYLTLIKKVLQDPTHQEREPLRRAAREAAVPVLDELRSAGVRVGELNALRPVHPKIGVAIPILSRWLPKVKHPLVRMTIVRRLSIPKARGLASEVFLREYETITDPNDSLKWAIGNGLSITATEKDLPELMRLARNRKHGRSREMIVAGLGSFDRPEVRDLLIKLLADDDVNGHALVALNRLRAQEAKPLAKSFLTDSRQWVRREAKKIISSV